VLNTDEHRLHYRQMAKELLDLNVFRNYSQNTLHAYQLSSTVYETLTLLF